MESVILGKELLGSLELNRIYQQDCLEGMEFIPDGSIDMILCDLPYGTTQNKWDTVIPLEALWVQYERIIKEHGAILLFAQTPFDKMLGASNINWMRYEWIWQKTKPTGFLNARRCPLKSHENILCFYKKQPIYNPQGTTSVNVVSSRKNKSANGNYGKVSDELYIQKEGNFPRSILNFDRDNNNKSLHPTQKPVELCEYLIKTYTNENEIVLDNCMGSGTTAVAALKTNRKFIGFETESKYIEIANKRLESLYNELEDEKLLDGGF